MYYYKARIYSPTLGRFLQTDPIGYEDDSNLYAYVGNDPIDGTDPTGTYGKGSGWDGKDKEWKRFDKAQKKAAQRMDKKAGELEKKAAKLDAKGKTGGDDLRTAASSLKSGAEALKSDGSDGKVANAISAQNWTLGKDSAAYVNGVNGSVMSVNLGHQFVQAGGSEYQRVLAHESLHTAGLSDRNIWGVLSYCCSGVPAFLANYRSLTPDQAVLNPDHLVQMIWHDNEH